MMEADGKRIPDSGTESTAEDRGKKILQESKPLNHIGDNFKKSLW